MSPRVVDKEQRKADIARAALAVFSERGIESTSVSQIANAAGISKGLIYLYFPSKGELIGAAVAEWVANIPLPETPDSESGLAPLPRLQALLRSTTAAFLNHPRIVNLFLGVIQAALREPNLFAGMDIPGQVSAPVRQAIAAILRDGAAHGYLRREAAQHADAHARNIVAFVDGLGLHYVGSPSGLDLHVQIDLFLTGLLDSLRVVANSDKKGEPDE